MKLTCILQHCGKVAGENGDKAVDDMGLPGFLDKP
jgi:hypothetical protein